MSRIKLYVVHGSHPCACVETALQMKGIPYKRVELMPPAHAAIQQLRFGARTVPSIRMADGEKLSGSRNILRRLEQLAPDPPLLPADPALRTRVEEVERWGDEVLQPVGRRLLWSSFRRRPGAMPSYAEHSRIPLPGPLVVLCAPLIVRVEERLNAVSEAAIKADLAALPGYLSQIDGWLSEGILGGEPPNAADLQIAPTLRLLGTLGDLQPTLEAHACAAWARRVIPVWDGHTPPGTLPAEWLALLQTPAPAAVS